MDTSPFVEFVMIVFDMFVRSDLWRYMKIALVIAMLFDLAFFAVWYYRKRAQEQ